MRRRAAQSSCRRSGRTGQNTPQWSKCAAVVKIRRGGQITPRWSKYAAVVKIRRGGQITPRWSKYAAASMFKRRCGQTGQKYAAGAAARSSSFRRSGQTGRPVVKLALLTLLWPAGALQLPGAPVSLPSPSRSPKKIAKAPPVRPAIKRLTSGQTGGQAGGVARLLPPAPSRPLGGLRFPSVIEGRRNKKSKKNTKIKL